MSPWLFDIYMDAVMKDLKMGRKGMKFKEEGRKLRLPVLLHADDFVLCGESEKDLRALVERFIEMCRRRVLKVNAGKSNVMLLESLKCEVCVKGYV